MTGRYLREHEVAEITGISVQTLRNWRCSRRGFPYTKVGRSIRYFERDIFDFMLQRRIEPEQIRTN